MKILIDLENNLITKIESLAENEKRSRKQMIELIIERFMDKTHLTQSVGK